MTREYDIVAMGAGHNGLVAAAYLAKAGKGVLLLERNPIPGGGVVTKEMSAPGFLYDQHSTAHIMIQGNPLIRDDELELQSRFGLTYKYSDVPLATIFPDQSCIITYRDVDRTCDSIARISPQDADTYRQLAKTSLDMLPMFCSGLYAPPAPMGPFFASMEQSEKGRDMLHSMQRSTLDIADEMFASDKVKIHLLKCTAENLQGPDQFGTGMGLHLFPALMHGFGIGQPVGGSGKLTEALVRCIEHHGGKVITDCEVSRVLTRSGRAVGVETATGETLTARDAVIAAIHPWKLGEFIEGLDPAVLARARRAKLSPFSLFVSHYALHEPLKFHADPDAAKATMLETLLTSDLAEFMEDFDPLRHGRMPERHLMGGGSTCLNDPTRVPAGKGNAMLQTFAPYELADGGAGRWDEIREQVADSLLDAYRHFVSNLGPGNIIARHIDTPLDHERWSPNSFVRGDAHGAGPYFFQINSNRPSSDLGQYTVPGVERLYLVGPFMHPGGGVFGAGRGTAIRMFEDLGMSFESVSAKPAAGGRPFAAASAGVATNAATSSASAMTIQDAGGSDLMAVRAIERDGASLLIKGRIFGTMPMTAVLQPGEARKGLRLLKVRTLLFLLSLPFRRGPGSKD